MSVILVMVSACATLLISLCLCDWEIRLRYKGDFAKNFLRQDQGSQGCSGILKEIGSLGLGTLLRLEEIRDSKKARKDR